MKKLFSLLLAVVMTLSFCACGSSSDFKAESTADYSYAEPAAAPAAGMMMAAEYENGAGGLAANDAMPDTPDAGGETVNPDKIIYSADATIETTEFDETVAGLNDLIAQYNGWIEASSVNGSNYYSKSRGYASNRSASYTVRIPSENFSTLMNSLSTLGNVPYTHTYTQNVTAQYYDTQARMNAYKAQEAKLLEMMDLAESVEDIITIEEKLTDVRYMIESLQSSLNNWDRRVNYSTVDISVEEVSAYTPSTPVKISYGERLINSFVGSVKGAVEFFKDLLVLLVSMIPTLVILAVLFFVFRPLFKKLFPKWKQKREARKAAKAAKKAAKAESKDKE